MASSKESYSHTQETREHAETGTGQPTLPESTTAGAGTGTGGHLGEEGLGHKVARKAGEMYEGAKQAVASGAERTKEAAQSATDRAKAAAAPAAGRTELRDPTGGGAL
ncbi:hypothetical protein ABPG77_000295 [Micractinium sp. CCAP 211/92]